MRITVRHITAEALRQHNIDTTGKDLSWQPVSPWEVSFEVDAEVGARLAQLSANMDEAIWLAISGAGKRQ